MKNGPRIWFSLKLLLSLNYCFLDLVKRKLYYGKRMSKLRKRNKSEEFEGYISIEGDNDHEVDDNDEVFLQVRAIVFCICI